MSEAALPVSDSDVSSLLATLVSADGTISHSYVSAALSGQAMGVSQALPEFADAMHYLCLLHGRQPGVVDHAAMRVADNAARAWLVQAVDGFAAERAYLTQVTVAVGPIPSTARQAECEATVAQQHHALGMLAQSDRRGTAIGAALALVLDWSAVRKVVDLAALRAGLEPRTSLLPSRADTLRVAANFGTDEAVQRAVLFGARQLLGQHRGLWDLLQARSAARAHD